jgi:hypothetical protein
MSVLAGWFREGVVLARGRSVFWRGWALRRVVVFKFETLDLVFMYSILIHVLVFNLAASQFIRFQF